MTKRISVVVYVNGRPSGCTILEPVSVLKYFTHFDEEADLSGMIVFTDSGNLVVFMSCVLCALCNNYCTEIHHHADELLYIVTAHCAFCHR